MDRDAAALGDVADHRVARHRLAALGVAHHQPVHALDLDAATQPDPVDHPAEDRGLGLLELVGGQIGIERPDDLPDRDVAPADRDLEARGRRPARASRPPGQPGVVGRIEPAPPDLARQDLLAQREADLLFLVVDPLLDLVPGPGGADVAQPVAARLGGGAGEDLDRIAALELPVQRRDPAVDLGALALETDLGVHVEREVDRRWSPWAAASRRPGA